MIENGVCLYCGQSPRPNPCVTCWDKGLFGPKPKLTPEQRKARDTEQARQRMLRYYRRKRGLMEEGNSG